MQFTTAALPKVNQNELRAHALISQILLKPKPTDQLKAQLPTILALDPNVLSTQDNGKTPVAVAASENFHEFFVLLKELVQTSTASESKEHRPIQLNLSHIQTQDGSGKEAPFMIAVRNGFVKTAEAICSLAKAIDEQTAKSAVTATDAKDAKQAISAAGEEIFRDRGLLMMAVIGLAQNPSEGMANILRTILSKNPDFKAKNSQGRNILHIWFDPEYAPKLATLASGETNIVKEFFSAIAKDPNVNQLFKDHSPLACLQKYLLQVQDSAPTNAFKFFVNILSPFLQNAKLHSNVLIEFLKIALAVYAKDLERKYIIQDIYNALAEVGIKAQVPKEFLPTTTASKELKETKTIPIDEKAVEKAKIFQQLQIGVARKHLANQHQKFQQYYQDEQKIKDHGGYKTVLEKIIDSSDTSSQKIIAIAQWFGDNRTRVVKDSLLWQGLVAVLNLLDKQELTNITSLSAATNEVEQKDAKENAAAAAAVQDIVKFLINGHFEALIRRNKNGEITHTIVDILLKSTKNKTITQAALKLLLEFAPHTFIYANPKKPLTKQTCAGQEVGADATIADLVLYLIGQIYQGNKTLKFQTHSWADHKLVCISSIIQVLGNVTKELEARGDKILDLRVILKAALDPKILGKQSKVYRRLIESFLNTLNQHASSFTPSSTTLSLLDAQRQLLHSELLQLQQFQIIYPTLYAGVILANLKPLELQQESKGTDANATQALIGRSNSNITAVTATSAAAGSNNSQPQQQQQQQQQPNAPINSK